MSRSRYFLSFFWPVAGYLLVVLAVVVWFVRPWDTTTSDAATVKSRAGPASTAGTESKDSDTKQNKDNLFYACILAITGALGVAGRQAAQAAREMYDADRHACQIEDEKAHFMSVVETANAQIEELHRSQAAAFREFEKKVAERQAEFNKEIETVKKEHENILCREKSKDIGAEAVRVE
ncbi:MAG: hypothetical protein HY719_16940, partial [Planctomycetes bacterium]|nr:hypothetical protein [Planctomycetota bacterium]